MILDSECIKNRRIDTITEEKQLPEEVVAALFMIGFIAAAVSATFTGTLADRFGRRRACLAFCLTYSLSCASLLSNNIIVLFVGRCLGGMSATLMYTVFESWMVTEFNKVLPDEPAGTLSSIFSTMTSLNTLVAILMGLLAEGAVNVTKTQLTPFGLSVCCLMLAFVGIMSTWVRGLLSITVTHAHILTGRKLRHQWTAGWRICSGSSGATRRSSNQERPQTLDAGYDHDPLKRSWTSFSNSP